ncbi:MAG: UDP-N-acetylmuramoylalanyl-D-glutamyl-2,6-diaminopimelate--D-alanyl-D-alanine ligase [Rhizobiaceae bacterium]
MRKLLWTTDDLLRAMEARPVGSMPDGITGISIDTRSIATGEAYFAIKGDVHDGHKFVANAYAGGASLSVISEDWLDRLEGETGPLLVVDDVLAALERLGIAARARTNAQVIAVTGSVGKTTTKEALRVALAPSGEVHAAVASFNNHWGVPLTLARMPQDTRYAVIEIGMNHPGEITPLVKMARPHVAAVMNVAAVHLGAFDSVDGIAKAKAEIFLGLEPEGTALINADDERISLLKSYARDAGVSNIVTFGEADGADVQLKKAILHGSCSCMTATVLGDPMVVKVGAPGRHIVQNVLGVLAACKLLGADLARAGLALADMRPVKGRGQRHNLGEGENRLILIDESYNANPTSMRAALDLLAATPTRGNGRHIAVMGDMLELGPTSAQLHEGLADAVAATGIDRVYLAGPEMGALHRVLAERGISTHAESIEALIPAIRADLRGGDVIMAKASLGMGFSRLIDNLLATANSG